MDTIGPEGIQLGWRCIHNCTQSDAEGTSPKWGFMDSVKSRRVHSGPPDGMLQLGLGWGSSVNTVPARDVRLIDNFFQLIVNFLFYIIPLKLPK